MYMVFLYYLSEEFKMKKEYATFAGGCFWCIYAAFEDIPGVISVKSGFAGGDEVNPTYEQVAMGMTAHLECVQIVYDAGICTYKDLLSVFWRQIDPTDDEGQFADRGYHHRTTIYYHNEEQRLLAEQSKKNLQESGIFSKPIVTDILPVTPFYEAEDYHQSYHTKNTEFYCSYRKESGRDDFLEKMWGTQHE